MPAGPAGPPDPVREFASGLPWPLPIRVDLGSVAPPEKAETAERSLRGRPGVVVLLSCESDELTPVLVSACGDVRAFTVGRLSGEGPRADLSSIVTHALVCECGSGFEADVAQSATARALMPGAHRTEAAARAVVFVHLDPDARVPACRVIDEPGRLGGLDARTVIGPFARRSHAEAFASMLDARFSLCREPGTLAQRPDATACAYKEMGACPAPCDGSEPMEAYRARAVSALGFDGLALERASCEFERMIRVASESMDFERAAVLTREREAVAGVPVKACTMVTTMGRFGLLAIMPSGRAGWARVLVHQSGETRVLGDVSAASDGAPSVIGSVAGASVWHSRAGDAAEFSGPAADAVALIYSHARSGRKTRGTFLPLEPWPGDTGILRAVQRAGGRAGEDPLETER